MNARIRGKFGGIGLCNVMYRENASSAVRKRQNSSNEIELQSRAGEWSGLIESRRYYIGMHIVAI